MRDRPALSSNKILKKEKQTNKQKTQKTSIWHFRYTKRAHLYLPNFKGNKESNSVISCHP